jgi:hypothetical protein
MAKRGKEFYQYRCTITDEVFTVSRQAPHPDELVSVKAWYDLNPDMDDRPEHIKKQIQADKEQPT